MNHRSRLILFVLLLTLIAQPGFSQPGSRTGAFMTCTDADGNAGLCARSERELAEGFSSSVPGARATLASRYFTSVSGADACERSPIPTSFEVQLTRSAYAPGDRLYLDELGIYAFDAAGRFLGDVPVQIRILGDPESFVARSNRDFIEFVRPDTGVLHVYFYCGKLDDVFTAVKIEVSP